MSNKLFDEIMSRNVGEEMSKSETGGMSKLAAGEPGNEGDAGNWTKLEAEPQGGLAPQWDDEAKTGMPAADSGKEHQMSEDDSMPEKQMSDEETPLESTAPEGKAAELESSSKEKMDPAMKADFGYAGAAVNDPESERYKAQMISKNQAADNVEGPGQAQIAHYTQTFDQFVAEQMEKGDGSCIPQPSLSWTSNLVAKRDCSLCKSKVPKFLTACPSCGHDDHVPNLGGGALRMEKSVQEQIRLPADDSVVAPHGVRFTEDDD